MVFYCGRPGCGRESTATLQIDAVAATVTLVDPRESRDGVPLCAHHADVTTPPMGWSMNDLRGSRPLNAVPKISAKSAADSKGAPKTTAKAARPANTETSAAGRSRRAASKAEPTPAATGATTNEAVATGDLASPAQSPSADGRLRFAVSREIDNSELSAQRPPRKRMAEGQETAARRAKPTSLADDVDQLDPTTVLQTSQERTRHRLTAESPVPAKAPASRPAKRREHAENPEDTDDKFPWHFQFKDDEPAELQAKSPLLSRAFRYSVG